MQQGYGQGYDMQQGYAAQEGYYNQQGYKNDMDPFNNQMGGYNNNQMGGYNSDQMGGYNSNQMGGYNDSSMMYGNDAGPFVNNLAFENNNTAPPPPPPPPPPPGAGMISRRQNFNSEPRGGYESSGVPSKGTQSEPSQDRTRNMEPKRDSLKESVVNALRNLKKIPGPMKKPPAKVNNLNNNGPMKVTRNSRKKPVANGNNLNKNGPMRVLRNSLSKLGLKKPTAPPTAPLPRYTGMQKGPPPIPPPKVASSRNPKYRKSIKPNNKPRNQGEVDARHMQQYFDEVKQTLAQSQARVEQLEREVLLARSGR